MVGAARSSSRKGSEKLQRRWVSVQSWLSFDESDFVRDEGADRDETHLLTPMAFTLPEARACCMPSQVLAMDQSRTMSREPSSSLGNLGSLPLLRAGGRGSASAEVGEMGERTG